MAREAIMREAGWKLANNGVPGVYVQREERTVKTWITNKERLEQLLVAVLSAMKSATSHSDERY